MLSMFREQWTHPKPSPGISKHLRAMPERDLGRAGALAPLLISLVSLPRRNNLLGWLLHILAKRAPDIHLIGGEPALLIAPDVPLVAGMGLNQFSLPCCHLWPFLSSRRRTIRASYFVTLCPEDHRALVSLVDLSDCWRPSFRRPDRGRGMH